jgi:hypothetical protein
VTCWGQVEAEAFGNARDSIFFDQFDDAALVLMRLMSIAKRMGVLARHFVKYAGHEFFGTEPWLPLVAGLKCIRDEMETNPRAPTSPASWRHFMQRHPNRDDGRPLDPTLAERLGGKMWATYSRECDNIETWL